MLAVDDSVTDFTTSISDNFHPMDEVASWTIINSTPFEAWKAGFRECVKLSSGLIKNSDTSDSMARLRTWQTVGADVTNGEYCIRGAQAGTQYGSYYADDPIELLKINDWEWLRERFERHA